ncbi:MAG TPA: alkaline phosphatase family protein, partial [Burkholderiales bacterium]|nr:alkaline phosphatase family protein [Burkholderiales bacterium]
MKHVDRISFFGLAIIALLFLAGCASTEEKYSAAAGERTRVIIYVWDGLRPDSVNPQDTPNLYRMRQAGVDFTDNHSTYPTFTMMNAASFATGGFPGSTGFYGNTLWEANASGNDAANKPVDFRQPVFTEDYAILEDLNQYLKGDLLLVGTLFDAAQKAGLTTAAVGKTGAAYIQDYKRSGILLDEKTVLPLSLAKELQSAGIPLPNTTPNAFPPGALALAPDNGNPIDFKAVKKLKDGVTFDPTDSSGSPYKPGLKYLADTYINYILPKKNPKLTVFWLRNPDTTQHVYGIGGPNYRDALRDNDRILGQLRAKLRELGQDGSTDIIVVSDHAHSNVAGASDLFPLRAIRNGAIDEIDPNGYSTSGLVRLADLLNRAGFVVFDGLGCSYLPGGVGIKIDGTSVYPTKIDRDGSICGKPGEKYMTASFKAPASLPPKAIVIAVNGGSDYLYVPDHDAETVGSAIRFLQSRSEVGAIFVDSRYGQVPGTLPLSMVRAENGAG